MANEERVKKIDAARAQFEKNVKADYQKQKANYDKLPAANKAITPFRPRAAPTRSGAGDVSAQQILDKERAAQKAQAIKANTRTTADRQADMARFKEMGDKAKANMARMAAKAAATPPASTGSTSKAIASAKNTPGAPGMKGSRFGGIGMKKGGKAKKR